MPWRESSVMNARIGFITDRASGFLAMTEPCQRYEICRKTGNTWLSRTCDLGAAGLARSPDRPVFLGPRPGPEW